MRKIKKQKLILLLISVLGIIFISYLNKNNFFQKNIIKVKRKQFHQLNPLWVWNELELEIDLFINKEANIEFIWINSIPNYSSTKEKIMPYSHYGSIWYPKKEKDINLIIKEMKNLIKIKKNSSKENYNNWYRLKILADRKDKIKYTYKKLKIPQNDFIKYNLFINGGDLAHEVRNIRYKYDEHNGEITYDVERRSKRIIHLISTYTNEISDYIIYQLSSYDFLNLENPTSKLIKVGTSCKFKIEMIDDKAVKINKEFKITGHSWNEFNFSQCYHFLFNFALYNTNIKNVSNE